MAELYKKHRTELMGFFMLWIVWYHLPFLESIEILKIVKDNGAIGVDAFVLLSGFGIWFSLSKYNFTVKSILKFYKRRFIRLIPSYYIFLVFFIVITIIVCGDIDAAQVTNLLLFGGVNWFIRFIILIYLVAPVFFWTLKEKPKMFYISTILASVLTCLLFWNEEYWAKHLLRVIDFGVGMIIA